jgi:adenylate kinase
VVAGRWWVLMDLILLGAPGAGKGTQGALLSDHLGVPKIATGDILREAVRKGTELGREAKRYMDAGELVPDPVVLGLVEDALSAPEAGNGAIFDGFPRTTAQADGVDGILGRLGRQVDAILFIEVPDEAIVRRMSGRRMDPETGDVYHLEFNPPPAELEERLVQREDDREETVRRRLSVYRELTAPLVERYEQAGVPIHRVDGDRPIEDVQADLRSRVGR